MAAAYDDDSEDVMAGIVDSDEEDLSSASTNPFMKFMMPTSLSPTNNSSNSHHHHHHSSRQSSGHPRHRQQQHETEKGVDRLLLMVKYPNAREEEIQEALKRKEIQQQALQQAALRKGQLFREKKQLEDAERWQQQQSPGNLPEPKMQSQEELEQGRNNIKKFVMQRKRQQRSQEGSFGKAILPRDEESSSSNNNSTAVLWQAATDRSDCVDFESGIGQHRRKEREQEQQNQSQNSNPQQKPKSLFEQTRESLKSVFLGGATNMFGPLAAADGNASTSGESLNTADGYDGRSLGPNRHRSEASVATHKISNIRPNHRPSEPVQNNIYLTSTFNNSNSGDDEENNKKSWVFDRKKNKLLIIIFSLVVVVAVIVTVIAALYGQRRRANIEASKSLENPQAGSSSGIDTVEFVPSLSPGSGTNAESPETTTTMPPIDNSSPSDSIPSQEDINEDGSSMVSSTPSDSVTTKPTLDTIGSFSMPTALPTAVPFFDTISPTKIPTAAPTAVPTAVSLLSANPTLSDILGNKNAPTSLSTESISSLAPIEQPFSDWVWSQEGEEGNLFLGVPPYDEHFGQSIALSDDGKVLVIGAPDALSKAGVVRIYEQKDGSWVSTGSLTGRNRGDKFGSAVALSSGGRVLAVSEPSFKDKTGNVRTFFNSPFGYMALQEIEGEEASDQFGIGISLSSDGRRMAVGAPHHDNGVDNDRLISGIARVFQWSEDNQWVSIGNGGGDIPLIGTDDRDRFGWSIDLNDDGSLLCIGAPRNEEHGGYVQCFEETNAMGWKQVGNAIRNKDGLVRYDDQFGSSIRISRDPSGTRHRVAIGAHGKDNENIFNAGHVVVYEFNPSAAERGWVRLGKKVITMESPGKDFRMGFSLDFHKDLLAVGIPGANGGVGKVEVFEFQKDSWEWLRNPTIFNGVTSGSLSSYGEAISMTPRGDLAVGSPQSNEENGSVIFYRRSS